MPFDSFELKVSTADGRNMTLLESFNYTRESTGEVITVPVGTRSDGASTPQVIWNVIPPFGIYWKAAFLHDYLYRDTQRIKEECDQILYEAMLNLGTTPLLAKEIYEGVCLGGWDAFKEDRTVLEAAEK